jgi:hypothetical protein
MEAMLECSRSHGLLLGALRCLPCIKCDLHPGSHFCTFAAYLYVHVRRWANCITCLVEPHAILLHHWTHGTPMWVKQQAVQTSNR